MPGASPTSDPQPADPQPADPQSARGAADDPLTRLESLLATAVRADRIDVEAEERAIAAFRAARDGAGRSSSRTRARDDWRPRGWRRPGRSLRAVVGALLASVTLGGVAVASMGVLGTSSDDGHRERPRTQQTAQEPTAGAESAAAPSRGGTTPPESSPAAGDRGRDKAAGPGNGKALCRAYASAQGRGRALDATAWRRLVDAAGGEASVKAYCDKRLAPGKGAKKKRTGSAAADSATGSTAGATGSSGKTTQKTAEAARKSTVAEKKSRGKSGASAKAESGAATAAGAGG
ncbi:hypothetical protein [Streptomyces jeddahensis]|uniref:Uncharacterized protein n=1 Tax=Streptomyces jeddahensis TaxID=1716141 RepID=A0A177HQA5_9ACTN|nr:hypothetical protein [Streptomyces jeddahensis]OAH13192.1 hypothetical protein STSP_35170 [Streptomyces jeddahensis]